MVKIVQTFVLYMIYALHPESNHSTSLSFFPNFMSQPFVNFLLFLLKILTTTWHNDNVKKVFGRLFETLYRQVCFLSKSCLTEFYNWSPFKLQKHNEDGQRNQEAPAKDVNIYVHVISPLSIVKKCVKT